MGRQRPTRGAYSMIVFAPIQVTDATLTSSNVAENDNPLWSAVANYNVGDLAMVTTPNIHKNYEALTVNINKYPPDNANTTVPTPATPDWLDLGATNRWAMFDQFNGSQTTNANTIDVEVTPNQVFNSLALLNLFATSVQVIVTDPIEGIVYDKTFSLISDSGINDWYAYYFTPIERNVDLVLLDLPNYPSATIRVIITEDGGNAAVGVMAIGAQVVLGTTTYGTSASIKDYSRKETDQFGNFTIVPRAFSKRADYAVTINTSRADFVNNYLTSIRTKPVVWVGNSEFGSTVIYGYYRDYDITLSAFQISALALTVEGLT